ncbi:probable BOI-related E3 ubiquitin-protein ligase 3 [Impatiens glandulifera]|uniref:probable BOI-related E3 ubiquitin-protein ligase 3 n=1 Tax=Impatiens glandulifera TaxID=253017 RepID=UPI001FB0F5ED|nr:probable BOI-related E3 ubiquitin-protein ligase 3 [Impatiens glandulifera]
MFIAFSTLNDFFFFFIRRPTNERNSPQNQQQFNHRNQILLLLHHLSTYLNLNLSFFIPSRNMHQGNGINPIFPFLLDENGLPYNTDGSTQLQPFQAVAPVNYNTDGYNFNVNNSTIQIPEFNSWQQQQQQQNLPTSMIMNTDHMSMGSGLNTRSSNNNSIGNDCGTIKAPQPHLFFINDAMKRVFDRHSEEVDNYIRTQAADLKNNINQLLQKQKVSVLSSMKIGVLQRLQAKEVEMMNMNQKNKVLEERIKQLTNETESWQTRAKHNESLFYAMKSQLEQCFIYNDHLQGKEGNGDNNKVDDASSSNYHHHSNYCRSCGFGDISVLLLPCRHLCLCEKCDVIVDVCPVCLVTKNTSLKVLAP